MELKIEYLNKEQLKPYANNAKLHPAEQVEQIKKSIEQFGFNDPIAVWHDNEVIEGHGRLYAAQELGLKTVPVIRLDNLTDEQRRAYMLVHNKLTMNTDFDLDMLDLELNDIVDIDMAEFGFDIPEEESEYEEASDVVEDEAPDDAETEERCKLGDIWKLGDHRLICGNSTVAAIIDLLMDGEKAELLLTDPPYGIKAVESGGHNDGKKAGNQMANDNIYMPIIGDDTTDTAKESYNVAASVTDNQIIFAGNYFTDFLRPSRCWIVWNKKVAKDFSFADGELAWTSFNANLKIYDFLWSGMLREGDRKAEGEKRVHPTQKPVGLMANILRDFSKEGDKVLDCFGGSGSTLIACEQTGRKCYMCELSEHYCDVIIQRWENFTGRKAERL